MKFIAHRGACLELQEDTLAALEKAAEYGAYAVECDPRPTAEGNYVIFHDDDLNRLAGDSSKIIDLTTDELKNKLAKAGLTLTTLDELINNYKGNSAVLLDLSFRATDKSFFEYVCKAKFRVIVGVHAPDEAAAASEYFSPENILAFMKKTDNIEDYINNGAGIIRLWEHWLDEITVSEAKIRAGEGTEIWIMSRDKNIHHPLFCMNSSEEQIKAVTATGADGILLNDIKLAHDKFM